ncbi:Na+/H+ antiporter [Aureimonas pseudogalii]|uniref:CPA1 family monovalent cation:H+ antiporter n=1 Tax=Aureimonas pseudogalii TaxID=1744844 RepID=A0A7W6EHI4_9HYPH|nr:Na+/H+ antiporter [Aureimonas pseudogalii]MBB3998264.1 CPA1 family monovalent cation:H+ antiporter [Aureimonas pseudogalii]
MEIVFVILALLVAVTVSGTAERILPIPLPLIQIAFGVGLALSPLPSAVLNPEIFFLLLLPPLLFLDGWRIPKAALRQDGRLILALALGLVVFTVVGIGLLIHALIPSMPVAVAFALAAVLAPTDPIAVSAIAKQAPVPQRLMHILEGESLLNDASGLVCLRFAVAAALTGSFSPTDAFATFVWLSLVGVALGVLVTLAVTRLQERILSRVGEDPGTQTLLSLLIPFAVYLVAEKVHASGILAAVSAGITMSYVENQGRALALTRMRRSAVWDTVQLAANGAIFVLLGEQLPVILERASGGALLEGGPLRLVLLAVTITAALAFLRFVWVCVSIALTLRRGRRSGLPRGPFPFGLALATSLAGVKGAVTLAGILTLPFALADGSPFPARDLAIFLAMTVILVSLLAATLVLPIVLRRIQLPPAPEAVDHERMVRAKAGEAARDAIQTLRASLSRTASDPGLYDEAAVRALQRYQRYDDGAEASGTSRGREMVQAERRLRLAGLRAERDALFDLRRRHTIPDALLARLIREVDLLETRFAEG